LGFSIDLKKAALFVGIFLLVVFVVTGKSGVSDIVLPDGKSKVACDVSVVNRLLSSPKIEALHCERLNTCLISSMMPSLSFVPKDTVYVKMMGDDGAVSGVVKLDVTEQFLWGAAKVVELSVCTGSSAGQVKLFGADNQVLESRAWSVT